MHLLESLLFLKQLQIFKHMIEAARWTNQVQSLLRYQSALISVCKVWNGPEICVYVINYHQFSGWKQHKFLILSFWRPEVWNGSHWAKIEVSVEHWSLLEALGVRLFPCLSLLLEAALFPGLGSQRGLVSLSHIMSSWPWLFCQPLALSGTLVIAWVPLAECTITSCLKVSWVTALIPSHHVT